MANPNSPGEMPPDPHPRLATLEALRQEALAEIEAAELDLARLRARIERWESDFRLGARPTPEYEELKGRRLPRAEDRLMEAFRSLLKLEDKIRAARSEAPPR